MPKIHFIGIKGVGMSALAIIARERGWQVSGSDRPAKYITDDTLAQAGIQVKGFAPKNITNDLDLVVVGGAWPEDHPEIIAAREKNIKVVTYSEFLGELMKTKHGVAISGSHGKTTTTALVALFLKAAGYDPSYLIGTGRVPGLCGNAHAGRGEYFVVEADEYRAASWRPVSKFLDLNYQTAILTGIEFDHPDFFRNIDDVENAFKRYINKLPKDIGFLVAAGDDQRVLKILQTLAHNIEYETYGNSTENTWHYEISGESARGTKFRLNHKDKFVGTFKMWLPGEYNVQNALAAIAVARHLNVNFKTIKKVLRRFRGPQRRFEVMKHKRQIFIDDYAHHPTAVQAFLRAVKRRYPKADIWAVFQAHTASRTKSLLSEFASVFNDADHVIITDIFASAREDASQIHATDLVNAIKNYHGDVRYGGDLICTQKMIETEVPRRALIATIGAGDVYTIRDNLMSK